MPRYPVAYKKASAGHSNVPRPQPIAPLQPGKGKPNPRHLLPANDNRRTADPRRSATVPDSPYVKRLKKLAKRLPYIRHLLRATDLYQSILGQYYGQENGSLYGWTQTATCSQPGGGIPGYPDVVGVESNGALGTFNTFVRNCLGGQALQDRPLWSEHISARRSRTLIRARSEIVVGEIVRYRLIEAYQRGSVGREPTPMPQIGIATNPLPSSVPAIVPAINPNFNPGIFANPVAPPITETRAIDELWAANPAGERSESGYGTNYVPTPVTHPGRPTGGTRERKVRNLIGGRLAAAIGGVTSAIEIVEAFYDALPDTLKNPNHTAIERYEVLFNNLDQVNVDTAFRNLLGNEYEDRQIGSLAQNIDQDFATGGRDSIGITTGPAI